MKANTLSGNEQRSNNTKGLFQKQSFSQQEANLKASNASSNANLDSQYLAIRADNSQGPKAWQRYSRTSFGALDSNMYAAPEQANSNSKRSQAATFGYKVPSSSETIPRETIPGEQFHFWKEQEKLHKHNRQMIQEDAGEQLVTETSMPEQAPQSQQAPPQESFRNPVMQTSPGLLGEQHFANDQECQDQAQNEVGQEGLGPEEIRLEVLRKIQMLVQDEEIYREFQLYLDERTVERQQQVDQRQVLQQQAQVINVDQFGSELDLNSDTEVKFPEDYPTEDLYSVYNRLYSHAMYKKRMQAEDMLIMAQRFGGATKISKSKGEQIGNRLYAEHKDRERRHTAKVLAVNLKEQAKRDQTKITVKSHMLVQDKLVKDIERVMGCIDYEETGYYTIRQVGQILAILKVFKVLFVQQQRPKTASTKIGATKRTFEIHEEERQAREEEFLMQLWYMLNPYGNQEKIEGRVLYVFLKLVYDPYWDGTQESMSYLIGETQKLIEDIKQLHKSQEAPQLNDTTRDATSQLVEVREQIDGMWNVDELVREMFSLADKFIDYKHGLVQLPTRQQRQNYSKWGKEDFTFRPRINKISEEIEKRNWQFRLQIEQEEQQNKRAFFYDQEAESDLMNPQAVQEHMFQKQHQQSVLTGRQSLAGKIVKRKDASSASIHNQSQFSQIQKTQEEEGLEEFNEDLKQYPMGELLLREEIQNSSMSQGSRFGARRASEGKGSVAVPYQKRVDLMMEREREKEERLENMRYLKELEEVTECTFKPRLIAGMKPPLRPYFQPAETSSQRLATEGDQDKSPVHERLYGRRNSANRPTLAENLAKQKEADILKECTFKPKINTNVQVPTDRSMFAKPSYSKRFNEQKQAKKTQGAKAQGQQKVGVFKNYSTAALNKAGAASKSGASKTAGIQKQGQVKLKFQAAGAKSAQNLALD